MFNAHPELHNRHKDVTGSLSMLGSRLAPKILSATGLAAVSHHVQKCRSGENRRTRRSRGRPKKILAGMRVQTLVFQREDATSDETATRRSGKPIELDPSRLFSQRGCGRMMPNLTCEGCQRPSGKVASEGNKPIPRCPMTTLHPPARKSADRNGRAGKGVDSVDRFSSNQACKVRQQNSKQFFRISVRISVDGFGALGQVLHVRARLL